MCIRDRGYTLADAYDVRQTQGRPLKEVHLQNDTRDMESAMTTLLNYAVCQVVIDKDLDTPAVYDPQRVELAINPEMCIRDRVFSWFIRTAPPRCIRPMPRRSGRCS